MRHLVLFAVILAGCSATQPKPEPIGHGRYTITAESTSQASNAAAVARRLALKKATRFCARSDRGINWETFEDGTTDHSYTTRLTFSCR